jgi:hypothetical protein
LRQPSPPVGYVRAIHPVRMARSRLRIQPLVVHHGRSRWTGPVQLLELIDAVAVMRLISASTGNLCSHAQRARLPASGRPSP